MGSFSRFIRHFTTFGLVVAALQVPAISAHAQLLDKLTGSGGSEKGGSSMLGGLGGEAVPSVGKASASNTAGVLQYCVRNNYVNSTSASSVKDSLMSKVTGSSKGSSDSGFQAGNKGVLDTGNGQGFSLGGDGIKKQVTQKVCDQVLQHAKSML